MILYFYCTIQVVYYAWLERILILRFLSKTHLNSILIYSMSHSCFEISSPLPGAYTKWFKPYKSHKFQSPENANSPTQATHPPKPPSTPPQIASQTPSHRTPHYSCTRDASVHRTSTDAPEYSDPSPEHPTTNPHLNRASDTLIPAFQDILNNTQRAKHGACGTRRPHRDFRRRREHRLKLLHIIHHVTKERPLVLLIVGSEVSRNGVVVFVQPQVDATRSSCDVQTRRAGTATPWLGEVITEVVGVEAY